MACWLPIAVTGIWEAVAAPWFAFGWMYGAKHLAVAKLQNHPLGLVSEVPLHPKASRPQGG